MTPDGLTFTIPRVPNADAAVVTGQVSTDFTGWMLADLIATTPTTLTYRVPATLGTASHIFLRAVVTVR
jgi:hypothetical protein